MAVTAYNFYLDGTKVTDVPQPSPTHTYDGLASATQYNPRGTALDAAGNESALSDALATLPTTLTQTYVDSPLSVADIAAVDAIVAASMTASGVPGVAISITGPRGYYTHAYGSAGARALSVDDHFRNGSVTKTFVSTAILQQVELATLALTDKLSEFDTATTILSDIPQASNISIEHMLTMRSGIYPMEANSGYQQAVAFSPTAAWSEANSLSLIRSNPSGFTPGTSYQYTNGNYVLLGAVLEAITGRLIKNILTEDVITPMLTQTAWPPDANIPAPYTNGSGYDPHRSIPFFGFLYPLVNDQTLLNPEYLGSAGALTQNIGDLHRWGEELRDGTLISPTLHALREASGNPVPYNPGVATEGPQFFYYGLGQLRLGAWHGHDGSVSGYDCCTMYQPGTGAVISVMENFQTPGLLAFSRLFYRIAKYLYPPSTETDDFMTTKTVAPTGIPSAEAFGTLRLTPAGTVSLDSIVSAEAFGSMTIQPPIPLIQFDAFNYGIQNYQTGVGFNLTVAPGGALIVGFCVCTTGVGAATCDGVAMTLVGISYGIACYKIKLPSNDPGGVKTIGFASGAYGGWCACAWSHTGVSTVTLLSTQNLGGTVLSFGPIDITGGVKLLQAWSGINGAASTVAFSGQVGGTNRINISDGNRTALNANEADVTTTFTVNVGPYYYSGAGAIAVRLS